MDRGGFWFSLLSCKPISDSLRSGRSLIGDDLKPSDPMKGMVPPFASKRDFSLPLTTCSSFSECNNERKPIMHDFMGVMENNHKVDQVGEAEHASEEISLDLKVGYGYAPSMAKKRKAISRAGGIKRAKHECHNSTVSLDLKLGLVDPWVIRKKIETSDIGHLARLLLAAECVKKHIFTLWDGERIEKMKNEGVPVAVWDCDTMSEHQLVFKQWRSGSYVLIRKWNDEFVKRRVLKKGDEIGLYWDPNNSRFSFSVLKRALRD